MPHDRIILDLDRKRKDHTKYAVLRVSTSADGSTERVHIREWHHPAANPAILVPTRGIALTYDELDAVIYALALVRQQKADQVLKDAHR